MKLFIKEESGCKCCGEQEGSNNFWKDALDKELFLKFAVPSTSTKKWVQWNSAIKDVANYNFMASIFPSKYTYIRI